MHFEQDKYSKTHFLCHGGSLCSHMLFPCLSLALSLVCVGLMQASISVILLLFHFYLCIMIKVGRSFGHITANLNAGKCNRFKCQLGFLLYIELWKKNKVATVHSGSKQKQLYVSSTTDIHSLLQYRNTWVCKLYEWEGGGSFKCVSCHINYLYKILFL